MSTEEHHSSRPGTEPVSGWVKPMSSDYTATSNDISPQNWDGNARIYDWSDEYGEVGPKLQSLELELFGDPTMRGDKTGLDFSKINSIKVEQVGPVKIQPIRSFKDAGFHPVMLENVALSGYDNPTPIQKYAIPAILQGYDVVGIAQTGSGKTAAYLLPILSKLMGKAKKLAAPRPNPTAFREGIDDVVAEPLVLVVVPTRELAVQIFNEARKLCYRTMLRPCVVYGGPPIREQVGLLAKGCDVLIGTPGRLIDFLGRPRVLTMSRLKHIVLDEADEMLESDWDDEMSQILSAGGQEEGNVKFALFSATFPKAAREITQDKMAASHVRFRVGRAGSTTENIKQIVVEAERHEKRDVLVRLLSEMHGVRTIIFVNSRVTVDDLDAFLFNMGLPVTSIHGERTQAEREAAMRGFRSGQAPILVATGLSSRGIDVQNVQHVINYDLPSMDHGGIEEYTHRIGRTGRIGHRGVATSLYSERDEPLAGVLTRTLLETQQDIPDFLQSYISEGLTRENLKFETESDFDENDMAPNTGSFGHDTFTGDSGTWCADTEPPGQAGNGWGSVNTAPETEAISRGPLKSSSQNIFSNSSPADLTIASNGQNGLDSSGQNGWAAAPPAAEAW